MPPVPPPAPAPPKMPAKKLGGGKGGFLRAVVARAWALREATAVCFACVANVALVLCARVWCLRWVARRLTSHTANSSRAGLLGSIEGFSKNALKKAETVDKSKPIVGKSGGGGGGGGGGGPGGIGCVDCFSRPLSTRSNFSVSCCCVVSGVAHRLRSSQPTPTRVRVRAKFSAALAARRGRGPPPARLGGLPGRGAMTLGRRGGAKPPGRGPPVR